MSETLSKLNLKHFKAKIEEYCLLVQKSQEELACYLGLEYKEFSQCLSGDVGTSLTPENIQMLIRALVEWGAITTLEQVLEVFDTLSYPPFTMVDSVAQLLANITPLQNPNSILNFLGKKAKPSGILTTLFTDIEGSTKLWEYYPKQMKGALSRHDLIIRKAIEDNNGYVFKMVGDAFCAVFSNAIEALLAAIETQKALLNEAWSAEIGTLRVRMALHTCELEEKQGDYVGPGLNRLARLMAVAYGGQILLTRKTTELVKDSLPYEVTLLDLGERQLKDLIQPERIFQVCAPDLPSTFPPLKTLETLPTNLPQQLTSFIGRKNEFATVKNQLKKSRIITLTGMGGTGKTRLSLELGLQLLSNYPDGIWLVELAAIAEHSQIIQLVAEMLGVRDQPGQTLNATLTAYLKPKQMLLILDNCEHVLGSIARLAEQLVRLCPRLSILATSREALNISGELTFPVPSLKLPPLSTENEALISPEKLAEFEAVQLFVERAQAAKPNFSLTNENAVAVAQICHRLDGIPLALELAAVRVTTLTVEQIAARLSDRFRLLSKGSRTALPRHQTLRTLIDWSYDLLSEAEGVLWQRLAGFTSGWSLAVAEEVCAFGLIEQAEVFDLLAQLVNKSLVLVDETQPNEYRYSFLETIRQYGREKLQAANEAQIIQERQQNYFLKLLEEADNPLNDYQQKTNLVLIQQELDNLRAIMEWVISEEKGEIALRFANVFGRFWDTRGYLSEGLSYLGRAFSLPDIAEIQPVVRAKALYFYGWLSYRRGDYKNAQIYAEESLAIYHTIDDKFGLSSAFNCLGNVLFYLGKPGEAVNCLKQGLSLLQEIGNIPLVALAMNNLGLAAYHMGELEAARHYYQEGLTLTKQGKDTWSKAFSLNGLGLVAIALEDYETAYGHLQESLTLYPEHQDKHHLAYCLNGLGTASYYLADYAAATKYCQESLKLWDEMGGGEKRTVINSLIILGHSATAQADYNAAQHYYLESLSFKQQLGNFRALCGILNLACSSLLSEKTAELAPLEDLLLTRVARMCGGISNMVNKPWATQAKPELRLYEQAQKILRQVLGEADFQRFFAEGQAMSWEEIVTFGTTELFPN